MIKWLFFHKVCGLQIFLKDCDREAMVIPHQWVSNTFGTHVI